MKSNHQDKNLAYNSLIAGSVSGMTSLLICHPMDILRTKIQLSNSSKINYSLGSIENYNLKSVIQTYYKGLLPPLLAQSVYKSVIFSTNHFSIKYLFNGNSSDFSTFVSGFLSGTLNSFVVSPVELIRSRQIINDKKQGAFETINFLVKEAGVSSLWRTLPFTILRDGPGVSIYLYTFNSLKVAIERRKPNSIKLSLIDRIFAGGMAGVAFWVYALPIDTIKTILESTEYEKSKSNQISIVRNIKEVYQKFGLAYLYRSWPVALGRGLPGAAITLTTYDTIMEYLNG